MQNFISQIVEKKAISQTLKKGGFSFKRFFVSHEKSPMKITTDSVLLGAWAPIDSQPKRVLDIGTGCGVIGLMLAQRLEAFKGSQIDVIDIDSEAIKECISNIQQSPFTNIRAIHQDIKRLSENHEPYDLIVCNPPYFKAATACRNQQRQTARYTEALTHEALLISVDRLLTKSGEFCLVLPFHLAESFIVLARGVNLDLKRRVDIRYNESKPFSLVLLAFTKDALIQKGEKVSGVCDDYKTLCMRQPDNSYTEAFRYLLKAFYLRF